MSNKAKDTVKVRNTGPSPVTVKNPEAEHRDKTLADGEESEVFFYQAVKIDQLEVLDDVEAPDRFDQETGEAVYLDEPGSEDDSEDDSEDGSSDDGQDEDEGSHDFGRVFSDLPHLNEDDNLGEIQEDFEDAEDFFENVTEDDLKSYTGIGDSRRTEIMSQVQG